MRGYKHSDYDYQLFAQRVRSSFWIFGTSDGDDWIHSRRHGHIMEGHALHMLADLRHDEVRENHEGVSHRVVCYVYK